LEIVLLDASYYNNPIGDSPGRLTTAVRRAQCDRPLPDCDYVRDIRTNHPSLVDLALTYCLENTEMRDFEEAMKDYVQIPVKANPKSALVAFIYVKRSTAPVAASALRSVSTNRIAIVEPQAQRRAGSCSSSTETAPGDPRNSR
jgi:hypothetical protein